MEYEDDLGDWQGSSRAPVVSATLRPPKRHGEDGVVQGASPKRQRPSPSPDANISLSILRSESKALLNSDINLVSAYTPAPQDALCRMDWVPTSGPIVGIDNAERDGVEENDPRICYGAVRKQPLPIPYLRAALR